MFGFPAIILPDTLSSMSVDVIAAALPPHPTLKAYYPGASVNRGFLREMFDATAPHYDFVEGLLSFGTGKWYRHQGLQRAGLSAGMKVLDVAVGTGLVAREEIAISGNSRLVTGLDPSIGMMHHHRPGGFAVALEILLGHDRSLPET